MTRDEAKQLLPIITAFANGETVQIQDCSGWVDTPNPCFLAEAKYYRIKPKPREFWLCGGFVYSSKYSVAPGVGPEIIHVKEVL